MISRGRIIGFRLTAGEETRFASLRDFLRCGSWSALVRLALKSFDERHGYRDKPAEKPATANKPAGDKAAKKKRDPAKRIVARGKSGMAISMKR